VSDKQNTQRSEHNALRRHDLVLSLVVWCICIATFIESWRLTFTLQLPGVEPDNAWLVAPGVFPLILSSGLLVMLSAVIFIAAKEAKFKGHFSSSNTLSSLRDPDNIRHIIQIALLCVYVFILVGRIHFGVASALYLFGSMLTSRAAKSSTVLIISIVFASAVTYLFGTLMKIPLP